MMVGVKFADELASVGPLVVLLRRTICNKRVFISKQPGNNGKRKLLATTATWYCNILEPYLLQTMQLTKNIVYTFSHFIKLNITVDKIKKKCKWLSKHSCKCFRTKLAQLNIRNLVWFVNLTIDMSFCKLFSIAKALLYPHKRLAKFLYRSKRRQSE